MYLRNMFLHTAIVGCCQSTDRAYLSSSTYFYFFLYCYILIELNDDII